LRHVAKEIEELEVEIDETDNQKGLTAVLRASEAASLEQVLAKRDANRTLMDKLKAEYDQIAMMHARYEEELQTLHAEDASLRHQIEEIRAARASMNEQKNDLEDRRADIDKRLTELYVRISANEKDSETEHMLIRSAEERIDTFSAQLQSLKDRLAEYQAQIEELSAQMAANRELLVDSQNRLDGLNARRKLVEEDGFVFEKKLNELNRKMREKMDEKEQIYRVHVKNENKLAQLRADQDKLSGKLWEDYELTRADALALGYPAVTPENRMSMIAMQTECRNRLRGMGNVDLDAVEKYKEVKEKYDTMSEQINDLEKSRKELLDIISTLEKDMKTSFVECFNQINENFGRVFAELFGGGSAELSLTDPDNILESGIEIKAAPPGKIIKNLMQLSGGEQSFIGVALFFAILQANPTPFCILDEIEAALDEVNVERLAQYIKRYSSGTQFIMITHRRGTMAAATRLYGVTMPEHGISKVLALDVENISKKKGDNWDGIFG
jgi:chromosome segregation protein